MSLDIDTKSRERVLAILAFHKIGEPYNGECPTWNYIPEDIFLFRRWVSIYSHDRFTIASSVSVPGRALCPD
jgi:hypothetical protein